MEKVHIPILRKILTTPGGCQGLYHKIGVELQKVSTLSCRVLTFLTIPQKKGTQEHLVDLPGDHHQQFMGGGAQRLAGLLEHILLE